MAKRSNKITPKSKRPTEVLMVVMPAFNEAGRVGKVVQSMPKTCSVGGRRFKLRVVVVDDCSDDSTSDEAKAAGATVLRHAINCGAGAATRTGMRYAIKAGIADLAYVVTIDSDGQHKVKDITRLVAYAVKHKASMVVGNRIHAGNNKTMPMHRTLGNRGLSLISRVLFGIKTQDTQSGLRLIAAPILPVISDYTIDRYGFCTDMLWQAVRHKIPVHELPISVHYSTETLSRGQNNWGAVDLLKDLLWIRITR
jgi:glycosyltransferase involved in cell wall biosynthesis